MQLLRIMQWTGCAAAFSRRYLFIAVILLAAGCGDGQEEPADSPGSSLPGVYAGFFPCQNCPGIQVTLWLRPDGRFFISQRYLEEPENDEMTSYNLGRWSWIAGTRALELSGAGPKRTFNYPDRDTLLMQTGSELEHRLSRQSTASDFTGVIAMTGTMTVSGDRVSFTECLTELAAPVERNRELTRFQQQYRSADARGRPAFVELEGRFSWSPDGAPKSLSIERFVTIRADKAC